MPFNKLTEWLTAEKSLGSYNVDCAVLATANKNGIPHSRIVTIADRSHEEFVFYTQRLKRKAKQSKAKQSKAKQSKAKQSKAKQLS